MKIALIQMNIHFGDPEKNMSVVNQQIAKAYKNGSDIIVLPELWSTGYDLSRFSEIGDTNGEQTKTFLSKLALKYNVMIIGGSVANITVDGIKNTTYMINRKGEVIGEYSKVHLFRLMEEEKYLIAGNSKGLFDLDGMKAAAIICYDIRFPEWIRSHVLDGANIIFVTAEWPKPRTSHWRHLLITRAIENQCYIVACNRSGADPNNEFAGCSMIIDPWGEIVAEAGVEETIVYGHIDLSHVSEIRRRIPVFEDRRPNLY